MEDIGIVTNDPTGRAEVTAVVAAEGYQLSSVNKKNDLTHLDGIVLYFNNENWLSDTIDWMFLLKKEPQLFVWVLLPNAEVKEKNIFFQLGANYVFSFPKEQQFINYTLSNTFSCMRNYRVQSLENTDFTLIENEVSMIVGQQEKPLTLREYKVLSILVEKKEATVSYEEFAKKLWPNKKFFDCNEMRSYTANIMYHIREKLDGSEWRIQTTRQKGYRLIKRTG